MPTYDYKCQKCNHVFEAFQKMSDSPLSECPICGSTVNRVISGGSFVFKGNGFYITDYKSTGSPSSDSNSNTGS